MGASKRAGVAGAAALAIVLVAGSVGPAGATRPAKDVAQARVTAADYSGAVLTGTDIQAFAATKTADGNVRLVTAGEWQPQICDFPVAGSDEAVAGRTITYSPSDDASLTNAVVAFPTTRDAKQWMRAARETAADCDAPFQVNTATFVPDGTPKIPARGDQRMSLAGTLRFQTGREADSLQLAYRQGQFVDYAQMLSFAPVTPRIVSSVAAAMAKRLDRAASAAKRAKPVKLKAGKVGECGELITRTALEQQLGVALQDSSDCSYALGQGAGGVDVSFTGVADGGRQLFPRLAQGKVVEVDGATDALYRQSTNQFGQVSETLYVLTDRGDYFSISLRGDDAPKDQRAQLIAAAEVAAKASNG
jgi:hypothetical protein